MDAYEEALKGVMYVSISYVNSSGKIKLSEQQLECVGITGSVFLLLLEVYYQYFRDLDVTISYM